MAYQVTVTKTANTPGGTLGASVAYTGSSFTIVSETVATGQTAFLINIAVDVSEIKSILILSDQAMTLKTNSSSAPDNTISLQANVPLLWETGSYYTNLLTADITKIYLANSSGTTANLYIECLQDATP